MTTEAATELIKMGTSITGFLGAVATAYTTIHLTKKAKAKRRIRKASSKKSGFRWWASLILFILTTAAYLMMAYYAFHSPSVALVQWTLITIAVFLLTVAVEESPLDKADFIAGMSLTVALVAASMGLVLLIIQQAIPKTPVAVQAPTEKKPT